MATSGSDASTKRQRKLALVIGIGKYENINQLYNPENDAEGMKSKLQSIGFTVTMKLHPTHAEMLDVLAVFENSIRPGDMILFYFAGHGIQWEDQNYLLPKDISNEYDTDFNKSAIKAQEILNKLSDRNPFVIVFLLDCCRTYHLRNPNLDARGPNSSHPESDKFKPMYKAGSLIAFACAPGTIAIEGHGDRNGLFTKHLLRHITTPNEDIELILRDVRKGVVTESNSRQIPFLSDALLEKNICLYGQSRFALKSAVSCIDGKNPNRKAACRHFAPLKVNTLPFSLHKSRQKQATQKTKSMALSINKYEYMDEDAIDDKLKCIICTQPLQSPVSLACQHIFCEFCIETWIKTTASCPTCRCQFMTKYKLNKMTNSTLFKQLDSLLVRCPRCNKTDIKRINFTKHLEQCSKSRLTILSHLFHKCTRSKKRSIQPKHDSQATSHQRRVVPSADVIYTRHEQRYAYLQNDGQQLSDLHPRTFQETTFSRSATLRLHERRPNRELTEASKQKIIGIFCICIFAIWFLTNFEKAIVCLQRLGLVIVLLVAIWFLIILGKVILTFLERLGLVIVSHFVNWYLTILVEAILTFLERLGPVNVFLLAILLIIKSKRQN